MDVTAWSWMIFKVAGGTILCQAAPSWDASKRAIRRLTELRIADPAGPVYAEFAKKSADLMASKIMSKSNQDKSRLIEKWRAEADQAAKAAQVEAADKPKEYAPCPDPLAHILAPIQHLNMETVVWCCEVVPAVAKLCEDMWTAQEAAIVQP